MLQQIPPKAVLTAEDPSDVFSRGVTLGVPIQEEEGEHGNGECHVIFSPFN